MEPPFTVARQALGDGAHRVAVCGEVDLATAEALSEALTATITRPRTRLVILDLEQVSFMDASGVRVLLAAEQLSEQRGTVLRIDRCSARVVRVLELCGVRTRMAYAAGLFAD